MGSFISTTLPNKQKKENQHTGKPRNLRDGALHVENHLGGFQFFYQFQKVGYHFGLSDESAPLLRHEMVSRYCLS